MRGAASVGAALLVFLLGLSFLGVSPVLSGYVGSLHPYLVAILLLLALFLGTLRARLRSTLTLAVALIFGGVVAFQIFSVQSRADIPVEGPTLKLSSFNVLGTNWRNGERIADFIAASDSDVFIVMEAEPIARFLPRIQATFPYRAGCDTQRCDLTIFSKLPFITAQMLTAGETFDRRVARLKLDKDGTVVTLIAAHITKPFLEERGRAELKWLKELVADQTGPLVVAGDFNQASWSPLLNGFLSETRLRTSGFEPGTFPPAFGDWGLPIDHVFVREAAIGSLVAISDNMGSNHRGLAATIALGPSPEN